MSKFPKVIIIQNRIPLYREYIYDLIGRKCQLTVAHSGKKSTGLKHAEQIILKNRQVGSINIQTGLIKLLDEQELVIAMFDLHWISSINALFYCRRKKIPFYWWGHGLGRSTLFNQLRLKLVSYSSGLILYSRASKELFTKRGIDEAKIHIAPNTQFVSNSEFNPKIEKSHFLFVGQLREIKRIPELIVAFERLKNSHDIQNTKLYIVGDGNNLHHYKSMVADKHLENDILFTGAISNETVLKELFQKSHAYVSPGDVGLGVLHSFAYGIPVITRHEEGANHGPEFYNLSHNVNGIIYDGNTNSLAECMKRFLIEKNLSIELGQNAHDYYVANRQPKNMVREVLNLIGQLPKKR